VGFSSADTEALALATRELAINLVRYAVGGRLTMSVLAANGITGIEVESQDEGPGIASIPRAMEDGYSTGGGLGSGLPGVRRLMDDFEIRSGPEGTRVTTRKWLRAR
jgi:serine/threonine-protein kinase RsbT